MRRLAAVAACAALVFAASAQASRVTAAADPLLGRWKVTKGGAGTFDIGRRAGVFAFVARGRFRLGCIRYLKGDVVGFAELRSNTALPKGQYSATFGISGSGCAYTVRLTIKGRTMSGRVLYSDDGNRAGPYAFARA